MAIPPNKNKLRRSIVGVGAPLAWWTADADACDEAAGVVTQQRDLVAGRVQTYPSGHRPVRTDGRLPYLTFNLNEGAKDSGGLFSGLGDATVILVWKDANYNAQYAFLVYYGNDGGSASQAGRFVVYTYLTSAQVATYCENGAGTSNEELTNSALDTNWHVNVHRWKLSDGTTAAKIAREDGSDLGSTRSVAGAVSGTFASKPFMIGTADTAFVSGQTFPAKGALCDVFASAYLSDAIADLVQQCFKALRGTP